MDESDTMGGNSTYESDKKRKITAETDANSKNYGRI